jgi:hypothetical protein
MAAVPVTGESLRPPSPVALKALSTGVGGLAITWTRRSRAGWSWVDGVDVPLGESRELYRLVLSGSAGSIEIEADEPEATIAAGELATVGTGAVSIEVRQIGDWAASRPAVLTIAI